MSLADKHVEKPRIRPREYIKIRGANEHNLKNLDVDIPRNELVVLTGLSGSGKSSLAFDTIYAEGQRRYMESLSSYARQFLGQMEKPNVEKIEGLSPAISIDQKSTNRNPRSTVGTVTEIYDYFRLLYARIGIPHCPNCGKEIKKQSVDQMVDQIMELPEGSKIQLLADFFHHAFIFFGLGVCVLLQHFVCYIAVLQSVDNTSGNQIHFRRRTGEVQILAAI